MYAETDSEELDCFVASSSILDRKGNMRNVAGQSCIIPLDFYARLLDFTLTHGQSFNHGHQTHDPHPHTRAGQIMSTLMVES